MYKVITTYVKHGTCLVLTLPENNQRKRCVTHKLAAFVYKRNIEIGGEGGDLSTARVCHRRLQTLKPNTAGALRDFSHWRQLHMGQERLFLLCFLSSYSIIQFLFSSYSSSHSSSYSRFCWQGHKNQAFCESQKKRECF